MNETRLSARARRSRQELPEGVHATLWDVLDLIAEDPERGERLVEDSEVRLYQHPEPPLEVTYEFDSRQGLVTFLHFSVSHLRLVRNIFMSYSHADDEWRDLIRERLLPFELIGAVRLFVDTDIPAGVEWDAFLQRELDEATAAILLVSETFLLSEYAREKEIPVLLAEADRAGFKLLWVLVRECDLEGDENGRKISAYQALLDPSRPLADLGAAAREKLARLQERFAQAMSLRR